MLAFRAHITTAAGNSLHIGVLANGQAQAGGLINQVLPDHRGAQLRCIRPPLRLVPGSPIYPTSSRRRAEAANTAPADLTPDQRA